MIHALRSRGRRGPMPLSRWHPTSPSSGPASSWSNGTHEDASRPATPDRRGCDRRSRPVSEERQGSDRLRGALGCPDAMRQGLSEHGAAQLSEARPVPGRTQGSRQPAGSCDQQEHPLRSQGTGSRLEKCRGGRALPARGRGRASTPAARVFRRRADHGTGDRCIRRTCSATRGAGTLGRDRA